jgi:hypothetical protein
MKKITLKNSLLMAMFVIAGTAYSQSNTIRLTSATGGSEGFTLSSDDSTLSIDATGAVSYVSDGGAAGPDYTITTGGVTLAGAFGKNIVMRLQAGSAIDQKPGKSYGAITTLAGIDRANSGDIGVRPASGTTNGGIDNGEGVTFGFSLANWPTTVTLQITKIYFSTFGAVETAVAVNRQDTTKKLDINGPSSGNNFIKDVSSLGLYVTGGSTLYEMVSIFNNSATPQNWRVTNIEFKLIDSSSKKG